MMSDLDNYFEANRRSWNQRTSVHKDAAFYDLEGFKKGRSVLNEQIEVKELGDVRGKTLLHLQCHFGLDTLSWQRMGAICTGVDFSDTAIQLAREINEEMKLEAKFIQCNVYDLEKNCNEKFDIVFTSYGTIGWLPDLDKWAAVIAHFLKPGGIFYIADFHPVLWMMNEDFSAVKYHYLNEEMIVDEVEGSYSDRNAPIKATEYGWNHPFSEIINALIKHGLQIQQLNEFTFSPYGCFQHTEKGEDGMWRIKGMGDKFPMMYSIKATKA
ncbi:MAG: methyltransferase domain-containing protein [Ferruginibacter sp.]